MVYSRPTSGFEKMVKEYPLMSSFELLHFLDEYGMARFCRLNKASFNIMKSVVNFKVLFEA